MHKAICVIVACSMLSCSMNEVAPVAPGAAKVAVSEATVSGASKAEVEAFLRQAKRIKERTIPAELTRSLTDEEVNDCLADTSCAVEGDNGLIAYLDVSHLRLTNAHYRWNCQYGHCAEPYDWDYDQLNHATVDKLDKIVSAYWHDTAYWDDPSPDDTSSDDGTTDNTDNTDNTGGGTYDTNVCMGDDCTDAQYAEANARIAGTYNGYVCECGEIIYHGPGGLHDPPQW